jgi:tripartite-type tricarboxylate transporter receptor subunit TctC
MPIIAAGMAALLASAAGPALAQFPEQPIRVILPFPPGSSTDIVARLVTDKLASVLDSPVVLEYAPGAGGQLAAGQVLDSPADGYTLFFTTPNHTINPAIYPNIPFDTEADFAPISKVAQIPMLWVTNAQSGFDTWEGFVEYAKAHPGELSYGSAGNGTLPHVVTELVLSQLGVDVLHIPYQGGAPALVGLLGNEVQLKMDTIASSTPYMPNEIKPLAIAGMERSPKLPDVPTINEYLPGVQGILWMGVLAPAGTPDDVVATLANGLHEAVTDPDLVAKLDELGVEPVGSTPEEFGELIHNEVAQWKALVKERGLGM